MAGVGFELKKLFNKKDGYIDTLKAYSISAVVTEGPMLLNIFMIFALQYLIRKSGASYREQELFFITITYIMIFSMILTSVLIMFISRYISDCIYEEKQHKIVSAFYGVSCLYLIVGGIICGVFIYNLNQSIIYKILVFFQFMAAMIIWIELAFLSAIKQYSKILNGFFICASIAVISCIILTYLKINVVIAALTGSTLGYFCMFAIFFIEINSFYPKGEIRIFDFISGLDDYKILLVIGTVLTVGLYGHNFVMWFSEYGVEVMDNMRYCMIYDVPAFYASMTLIPLLVRFVVSLETNFYDTYRIYFNNILYGGRMKDIDNAKENMIEVLFRELARMMEIQGFCAVISVIFISKILQISGFDSNMIEIFRILCFGYALFGLERSIIIIMLYLDDRVGACISSVIFTGLSIILSKVSVAMGISYYGTGFVAAGFIASIYSLFRLRKYILRLDYNVFCKQPLFYVEKKRTFLRISDFFNSKLNNL